MSDAMVECLERGIDPNVPGALMRLHAAMHGDNEGCRSVFRFCPNGV